MTTIEQVQQALGQFTAAHVDAENKIAAVATLKLSVGSNEADRKKQAVSMPADEYAGYVLHLAEAEKEKAAAVATLERREKELNVLRELLNHDTADIGRQTAGLQMEVAQFHHATLELAKSLADADINRAAETAAVMLRATAAVGIDNDPIF